MVCSIAIARRVPVLAIAAHIPSLRNRLGLFPGDASRDLFRECSHYCEFVSIPEQLPRAFETAIRDAVEKRGVSVIVMPGDVALKPAPGGARAGPPCRRRQPRWSPAASRA